MKNKFFTREICVCAHLTQTRLCAKSVRRNEDYMQIYLYGMVCRSHSFKLDAFPIPDEYTEIRQSCLFPGGETGTCATVLASLGADVVMDGTHVGRNAAGLVREFYRGKTVNLDSLTFDDSFEGVEDYVLISGEARTPLGTFGRFFTDAYGSNIKHWNKPKESDVAGCVAAAIDDCFGEDSQLAAALCVKRQKPYVTIDCKYDSYIHKHAAVSVISGEGIGNLYKGRTREELFPLYVENGGGLTIMTNGGKEFYYGRRGGEVKAFLPFQVSVASTLGAGDSFKAGCTYALALGMNDDETVRFASACAAVAVSRYPMQFEPPTLKEIEALIHG